jgi:PBP1b-binding outer membrane lipoprotein LpoB
MKAIVVGLLIAGVLVFSSCNAAEEQASQEEETTEETTETAAKDPDQEIIERC